ncbi:MAG TPA: DNA mismatch repair protein [Polyangiaceae bacterium]|nr:DNA mismatch repair protein [Polyangiaceae bacterium]
MHPDPAVGPVPDLLSVEPSVRVDLPALRQLLVFAFATGASPDAFDEALGSAALPASSWDAGSYARDLFLGDLVARALPLAAGGRPYAPCEPYLLRAIAAPPRDPAVTSFRQGVLGELAEREALRRDFERLYAELVELRTLLCASRLTSGRLRRVEILRQVRRAFETLAGSFGGAASGLARLREFGEDACASEAFRRLEALLDYDEKMATVDVRVAVGADGELRTFEIVSLRESTGSPFYSSPLGRLLVRLRLALRGYRMSGGELAERFVGEVFGGLEDRVALLFQLLGDMQFYLCGLGFRDLARGRGLEVCFPEFGPPGGAGAGLELARLFNPLLLADGRTPVPCDLATTHADATAIVTGPNSGGKTRLLQAVALAQLFAGAGLYVPAARARLPRFAGLFVSLLDEARADQPEGQLGMELLRIRRMFERLAPGSLVLLDELCSGTNPSEGEEIARLVITLLPELDSQVFITTHLLQFAERLEAERPAPRLEFLQVELDGHERPTYGFVPGVARTSLAHRTAARLGVTRDELLALIAEKRRAPAPPPPGLARPAPAEADDAPLAPRRAGPTRARQILDANRGRRRGGG